MSFSIVMLNYQRVTIISLLFKLHCGPHVKVCWVKRARSCPGSGVLDPVRHLQLVVYIGNEPTIEDLMEIYLDIMGIYWHI